MLWITHNLPEEKKDKKRWLEIASERDWEWCSPKNNRVYTSSKRKRLGTPWGRPTVYTEYLHTEKLKNSFIWISFFLEGHNIKGDFPRDIFEEICSYL